MSDIQANESKFSSASALAKAILEKVTSLVNELDTAQGDDAKTVIIDKIRAKSCQPASVRSGWTPVDCKMSPAQYQIILAEGLYSVRIVGDLDDCMEPCNAKLEHQQRTWEWKPFVAGWHEDIKAKEILLVFAKQHYFGGED